MEQEIKLPEINHRCTAVLTDTLEGYAGIRQANFDVFNTKLSLEYDPRIITPERALHLVKEAGRQAGKRVMQCAVKGDLACQQCAVAMEAGLYKHYENIANLDVSPTTYQNGVMEVNLRDLSMPGSGASAAFVETIVRQPVKGPVKLPVFSRRQLEVAFTVITLAATIFAFIGGQLGMSVQLQSALFVVAFLFGGVYGLIDGIDAAREEKKLDVNLLMILAALGAAIIGQPMEGAVLLFLFSLSNTLQTYALERNRRAIEKLLDLRPPQATVRRGSRVVTIPVEKVQLDDTVLVKPGERFPVDGEILGGESDVDQATITGESVPVHKTKGEVVFAGTVNGNGALEVKVTRLSEDTTLARIVQMVENAQSSQANTQTALDKFEQVYAWFVLGGAVLLTVIPYFLMGQDFMTVFYRAMTWLVVASPCALVISTPAAILSGIANGAKNGILFKGGIHLEKTADLKVIAFDKTGTLTEGKPALTAMKTAEGIQEADLIRLVAAVEARSEHPLGRAILQAAEQRSIDLPTVTEFRAIPGQGVQANVEGQRIWVGNLRMFAERGVDVPVDLQQAMFAMEQAGQTAMLAYSPTGWLGILGVADTLREDAPMMIQALKAAGIERTVMLTGDNERVAKAIAAKAGVDEVHASLLPQDKVRVLETLRQKYGTTAMIGDGVNDAPALAISDVGIAMGGAGSDVALETADIVLMADDLSNLPFALRLARKSRRILWQNLSFALAVIVLLVVSAFGFNLALPLGVVGHEGSTVLVVLNGLRLLAFKK